MLLKNRQILLFSLFILGFSSLFFQIYLLREVMRAFQGNELVIGIVLANWMILTAAGAYLGKLLPRMKGLLTFTRFLQLLFALIPLLTILKLDLWRISLPSGSMVGLTRIITTSFLMQLPFCILNGFLFSAYAFILSRENMASKYSIPYAIESAGSFAGGLLVNFALLWWLDAYQGLRILLLLNVVLCLIQSVFLGRRKEWLITLPLAAGAIIAAILLNPDHEIRPLLFPGQEMLYNATTPYGTVTVTRSSGQLNFYENGLLMHSGNNEIANEESVHFPMVQRSAPGSVLVISGDLPGMASEILKYPVKRLDLLEIDPGIVKLFPVFCPLPADPRVHLYNKDGRSFVKHSNGKYDVVILSLPGPSTLQINRYYTVDFFRELRQRMDTDAVVSLSLPLSADYVSKTLGDLNGSIYNSLKQVFKDVTVLPGQKNYFLASDAPLRTDIAALVQLRGIRTLYVNPYYFDDGLQTDRSHYILTNLPASSKLNRDFRPSAFFAQLAYWSGFFKTDYILLALAVILIFGIILASLNVISTGMFTGGFTASSAELLLMVSFQVIYGSIYQVAGTIIMLFMAGLALGSLMAKRVYPVPDTSHYLHIQMTMALYCLGFPFIILAMTIPGVPDALTWSVFGILTLLIAFLTGLEFCLASEIRKQTYANVMSENYSADLFGSAFGALVTGIILFPVLGIVRASLFLVVINLISAFLLSLRRKKTVSL